MEGGGLERVIVPQVRRHRRAEERRGGDAGGGTCGCLGLPGEYRKDTGTRCDTVDQST